MSARKPPKHPKLAKAWGITQATGKRVHKTGKTAKRLHKRVTRKSKPFKYHV